MYLLTELVRLLEQRGHHFDSDPRAISESLRHTDDPVDIKLHHRAALIDRRHQLRDRLHAHQRRWQWFFHMMCIAWFVLGVVSAHAFMQPNSLNFFFLLMGILGLNTLMLMIWIGSVFFKKPLKIIDFHSIKFQNQDIIGQSIWQLYGDHHTRPHAFWQRSETNHRLALCGLLGIFFAVLFLLTVRQYGFNWQSTLLGDHTFARLIALLSWLPEQLGFATPDTAAIIHSRNANNIANATQWSGLLLGSLLCYGLIPRALAWGFCLYKRQHDHPQLDLNLPYYQSIIQKWQQKIIDPSDDYRPDSIPTPPPIRLHHHGQYWAIELDTAHHDSTWFEYQLGQHWIHHGALENRTQIADFIEKLSQNNVQLLVGVRANHVPDRGTMRTLQRLAKAANQGLIVQLLLPPNAADTATETLTQWRNILREHQWAWLEMPPHTPQ